MRCPVCRRILTLGDPPHCRPCNTPVTFEHDSDGHLRRAWNSRSQIVFMARASHRLDDVGAQRARSGYNSPIDQWSTGGYRTALIKERRPT